MPGLKRDSPPSCSPALSYSPISSSSSSPSSSASSGDDHEELEAQTTIIQRQQTSSAINMSQREATRKKLKVSAVASSRHSGVAAAANATPSRPNKRLNPFSIEAIMQQEPQQQQQQQEKEKEAAIVDEDDICDDDDDEELEVGDASPQQPQPMLANSGRKTANVSPPTRPTSRASQVNSGSASAEKQQQLAPSNRASSDSSSAATAAANNRRGSTNHLLRPQVCRDPRLAPFECHLDNLDLWHRFHPLDTEMIITKQGR